MRDVLLARVRPQLERLATELTELAATRIEAEIERMREAFEVALSSYASNSTPDILTAALGPELAAMLNDSSTTTVSAVEDNPRPTKRSKRAATPVHRESEADGNVAEPHRVPTGHRAPNTVVADTSTPRKKLVCGKCGFLGGNQRGCGKSHPTQTAPAPAVPRPKLDAAAKPMTAIAPERPRALTAHELAAAKARSANRDAASALAAMRAPRRAELEVDDNPNAEERWSPERRHNTMVVAEGAKRSGELPLPRSTVESGDVEELDLEDAV